MRRQNSLLSQAVSRRYKTLSCRHSSPPTAICTCSTSPPPAPAPAPAPAPGPAASMVFVVRCLFWVLLGVGGSVCELWMLLAGRERDARGRARGGLMTDAYYFSSSSLLPRRRSPLARSLVARSSSLLLFSSGGLAGAAWLVGGLGAKRAPLVLGDFANHITCQNLLE